MAVLLRLGDIDGPACDARCYGARLPRCTCRVCGGLMHGVGRERAFRVRDVLLKQLDDGDVAGVVRKGRKQPTTVILHRRVRRDLMLRLRGSDWAKQQMRRGQLPLFSRRMPFRTPQHLKRI